jgi:16S rRNA (cytosine967-C5)-methyltransferase
MEKSSKHRAHPPTSVGRPQTVDAGAGLGARTMALDVLDTVLAHSRPLGEAFETHPGLPFLSDRDRRFALNLISTVLRRMGQIDALIEACLARPLAHRYAEVRDLLRIGVAQLAFLRTPAHAAVYTTVALAKSRGAGAHTALINAILRRLATDGSRLIGEQDAARLNTPDWLWRSWLAAYGEATTRAIAAIHVAEPPLDLTPRSTMEAQRLAGDLRALILPTGSLRLEHAGPIHELPGYREGAWWVQDAAAALPVRLLDGARGRRVLDLCGAPGGKTAQLAAAGAQVTAVDRSPKRVGRLKDNLLRLALKAEVVVADVAHWRPSVPFDRILLDVPCSATGTIRRHPDIPWLKTPAEVAELAKVQGRLLAAASEMLAPGGILVYCACSLQREEGTEIVDSLIGGGRPFERLPIQPSELYGLAQFLTSAGDMRTLPCHMADVGGLDGFYAARVRKLVPAGTGQ